MVGFPGNQPPPSVLSKSHLININLVVVAWGLLGITGHPFYLYGSKAVLGTEDKRPNMITKDAPIALITQEIPKVWQPMDEG